MSQEIKVKVNYNANSECKKQLVKNGVLGETYQSIIVTMPVGALDALPINFNNDGTMYMDIAEHHYYQNWKGTINDMDGISGAICLCCDKRTQSNYLSKPIVTFQDVLDLLDGNNQRKAKVEKILADKVKQENMIAQLKTELTAKITNELETKYAKSFTKIEKIKCVITGKARVRTSQIEDIIYD